MLDDAIDQAADRLAVVRGGAKPFTSLPAACRPANEAQAYAIQDRLHAKLEGEGYGQIIGHKIGCTTEVMQRYLGIHNPCAGGLFLSSVQEDLGQYRHADFHRVGVECEIAVRLGADLEGGSEPFGWEQVAAAVEACMAAIEIVDDRYVDYKSLDTPTLIADDFFNAGAVLGASVETWRDLDLASLEGRMTINGETFGPGHGADILGHPLNALIWLAEARRMRGQALRRGNVILLGSVVQTRWLEVGDRVDVEIDGLGNVSAEFT